MTAKRSRRNAPVFQLDALLAASTRLAFMHEALTAQGYACSGGQLSRRKDGTWSARLVWRNRPAGLSVSFSAQGLVLRP